MVEKDGLKPPFDEEFPDSGRDLPEHIERAIEQGTLTPRMIGYRSGSSEEVDVPTSEEELDELQQRAEELARKYGGNPDDYDWRYQ